MCLNCCPNFLRLLKVYFVTFHGQQQNILQHLQHFITQVFYLLANLLPSYILYICYKLPSLSLSVSLHAADSDAETDEDEGHIEDAEKAQQREREKHDDSEEQSNKDIQDTEEDVAVSLLRAKNLSLLQSQ